MEPYSPACWVRAARMAPTQPSLTRTNTFVLQNLSKYLNFEPDIPYFKMKLIFDPKTSKLNCNGNLITDDLSHTTTGKLVKRVFILKQIMIRTGGENVIQMLLLDITQTTSHSCSPQQLLKRIKWLMQRGV
ncbi:Hypothetical_protein [Hexamita inflata]|uniref:Hypothetical_protein n=1 Tax=Hexamita inflata TaxID=28002 RepID=A0AA86NQA2_9EUKA|nr:Hypothetical protein HINF_LOCUS11488 [Hexamita inflata]